MSLARSSAERSAVEVEVWDREVVVAVEVSVVGAGVPIVVKPRAALDPLVVPNAGGVEDVDQCVVVLEDDIGVAVFV